MNILLAEDNPDDVFLFEHAVKKAGFLINVNAVGDGAETVSYLRGEGAFQDRSANPVPDLLLLDLNMPRMNGFDVLQWIRQDNQCKRLIVHVLSSSCRDVDIQRAFDLHANSYVMKPTRVDELVRFVKALHEWHQFSCRIK